MLALSILLLLRKNYKFYPAFLCYILAALWQSVQFGLLVRDEGDAWPLGWITLIVVLALRALAVLELGRNVLANFRGIWTLARALLLFSAAVVTLSYGVTALLRDHALTPLSVDIGAQLGVAVAIVFLLAFARYYHVIPLRAQRLLAVSLCVYSCLSVINDIFLQRWARSYSSAWALVNVVGLTAIALPWLYARLQKTPQASAQPPSCLDETVYHTLSPRINSRLRLLNGQLAKFCRPEAPGS